MSSNLRSADPRQQEGKSEGELHAEKETKRLYELDLLCRFDMLRDMWPLVLHARNDSETKIKEIAERAYKKYRGFPGSSRG